MSNMRIIDENGNYEREGTTLKPKVSNHPVHKARVAVALGQGSWLYFPDEGHGLAVYAQAKASDMRKDEFEKVLKLYLQKYGAETVDRFIKRGILSLRLNITKETING